VEEAAAALAAAADIEGGSGGAGEAATTAVTTDGRELHSFEIDPAQVEHVKQRCLPGELNYPTLEEYDFRADTVNPDVPGLELKPATQVRPYQDKSLSKMFGNGTSVWVLRRAHSRASHASRPQAARAAASLCCRAARASR
jgi:DNA excision repair protein ERCC-3